MKSGKDESTQRYLLLFKLDAASLIERIRDRRSEYLEIFSTRRTREHFPEVFRHRYGKAAIGELAHCSGETILALDQFYKLADEMRWYLYVTQDMPGTVDDNIYRMIKRLEKLHATLDLFLEAEMSIDDAAGAPTTAAMAEVSDFVIGEGEDRG